MKKDVSYFYTSCSKISVFFVVARLPLEFTYLKFPFSLKRQLYDFHSFCFSEESLKNSSIKMHSQRYYLSILFSDLAYLSLVAYSFGGKLNQAEEIEILGCSLYCWDLKLSIDKKIYTGGVCYKFDLILPRNYWKLGPFHVLNSKFGGLFPIAS